MPRNVITGRRCMRAASRSFQWIRRNESHHCLQAAAGTSKQGLVARARQCQVMRATFVLSHDLARRNAVAYVQNAPIGYVVQVKPKTRSLEQNARLWACLQEVSDQVVWHGRKLTPVEWKFVFSAALTKQEVVPGIDGGFVVLGQSTSQMSVREMNDLLTLIDAFAAQHGVTMMEPA